MVCGGASEVARAYQYNYSDDPNLIELTATIFADAKKL
jgi:hypothetical protein